MTTLLRSRSLAAALLFGLASTVSAREVLAQAAIITGKVASEQGQLLQGANVLISELNVSVGTNAQGVYTITIPSERVRGQAVTLRVRSIGFVPQTRNLTVNAGSQTFDFTLRNDVNRLSEIVVTGVTAGTEKTKLPFTVASVTEADMPVPGANPLAMLQGKVPGAAIVSASGRPGSQPAVILRGPQSINGMGRGQEPLYIVDGVILQGTLPDLNPLDIESVEVVKGAAAASLYGSRAGNGVIQITTKSGKNAAQGTRIGFRTEYGQGDIEREFPLAQSHFLLLDETGTRFCEATTSALPAPCSRTIDFEAEALRINELGGDFSLSPRNFAQDGGIALAVAKNLQRGLFQVNRWPRSYSAVDQLVTPGQFSSTNLDVTGKASGTSYFASVSNFWQEGAIQGLEGFRRNSIRANVDQTIGENFTLAVRSFYANAKQDGANQSGGNGFFRLTRVPAGVDLERRDKFGRLFIRSNPLNQGSQNDNPLYSFANSERTDENDRFIGGITGRYAPLSWLDFEGNVSYDRTNSSLFFIQDKGFRTTTSSPANLGQINRETDTNQSYNVSLNASARRELFSEMQSRFSARYLYEEQDFQNINLTGINLAVPGLGTADAITQNQAVGSDAALIRAIGILGGIDLEYKERFILGGLFRRDGSSLFGSNARWANYGRGSFAYRMAQENWWFAKDAINEFKVRASVGTAGGRPRFNAQYETFSIGAGGALTPVNLGNKDLSPETVTETEYGLDAEFFSRYGLTFNFARSISKDQILLVPVAAASGFASQWRNAGTLDNKTFEVSLNIPIIQGRDLNYSARLNWDRNRAVITRLDVPPFFNGVAVQGAENIYRFAEGERLGAFYGRKFATSCSQLPANFQAQCGGAGSEFQRNNDGYVVWVGQGNTLGDGIKKNLWQAQLPGCTVGGRATLINGEVECTKNGGTITAPWGNSAYWGSAMVIRDSTGAGQSLPLGNALPNFRWSVGQTASYKRLSLYALVDAAIGGRVWNQGRHWSLGDFMNEEQDQNGKTVETAKPIGYYWRAPAPDNGAGTGGFYDFLAPNSYTTEDASFAKLREVSVGFQLGRIAGAGDWTVSLVGRNLFTWTDYTGFDPEVGITGGQLGSAALNAVDRFGFPNLRTFTVSLGSRF